MKIVAVGMVMAATLFERFEEATGRRRNPNGRGLAVTEIARMYAQVDYAETLPGAVLPVSLTGEDQSTHEDADEQQTGEQLL